MNLLPPLPPSPGHSQPYVGSDARGDARQVHRHQPGEGRGQEERTEDGGRGGGLP